MRRFGPEAALEAGDAAARWALQVPPYLPLRKVMFLKFGSYLVS